MIVDKVFSDRRGSLTRKNTIIGGIGGTITTGSALAAKLGIDGGLISNFEIVGSDVICNINSTFRPTSGAFENDQHVTSYFDFDGKVVRTAPPFGNTASMFKNSDIKYAYFPQPEFMNGMFWNSKIENLDTPNLSEIPNSFLLNVSTLISWNHAPIITIDNYGMQNCPFTINLDSLLNLGNDALSNTKYTNMTMNSIVSIMGTAPIRNNPTITSFYAPNLEWIQNANSFFNGWTACNLISCRKLKHYGSEPNGGATNNAKGFVNLKSGCKIEVHEDLLTANAGAPHGALVWVKANRSATVEFYDDDGNYVSTL